MCYSDFPIPADFPNYLHHTKFLEYFRMYVDHFQLEQYIRFEREVLSVEQQVDGVGRWSVTTRSTKDSNDTATEIFDAVMVCSGIHNNGYIPIFEGQDKFKGEIIHTVNYRQALLSPVSTTQVHGPSSRAELTARELGCIF